VPDNWMPCCSPKKGKAETNNAPPENPQVNTRGLNTSNLNLYTKLQSPSQGRRITAILEKLPQIEWGFEFDLGHENGLLVTSVADGGFIAHYNASWPYPMIEPGDLIEQVDNEKQSNLTMKSLLLEKSKLTMIIRKPWRFGLTLTKPKGINHLGIDLTGYKEGLLVLNVEEGFISEYNASHPDQKIQVGDWIEQVNGEKDSGDMRDLIEHESELEMVVRKSKMYWYNDDMATPIQDEIPTPLQSASTRTPTSSYRSDIAPSKLYAQPPTTSLKDSPRMQTTSKAPLVQKSPSMSPSSSMQSLSYMTPIQSSTTYI